MDSDSALLSWSARPLRELIRHIVLEYHDCLRLELPKLDWQLAMDNRADPVMSALIRSLLQELDRDLSLEEDVLLPAIRQCEEATDPGSRVPNQAAVVARDGVLLVLREHDRIAELFRGVEHAEGALLQQLQALEADFRALDQLEREILFPRTLELIRLAEL